ncbi:hypothetical protein [Geothrix sp. PMB-07]|uniref:N-acyl amino acid synthase FeeM domain-containing protein n=1 Tax=Geothrix sp. PMB-07 TaxID=3068640 RepID=UPI0027404CFD|nr:hypothetical protein [Geothrix sp. PMB-07]WLT31107.1 hypothetical protein Q9293_15420 [Geothrix sp. PMB-07]
MMGTSHRIQVVKVRTQRDVRDAARVLEDVFQREKGWIQSAEHQIPTDIAQNPKVSWFLARAGGLPVGLLRLVYDPALELPPECLPTFEAGVDLQAMAASGRFVEIGRFMIRQEYRRDVTIALRLMRKAAREVVERDYTHFLTDVFENEPNSPFHFHTRILGFEVVGRHVHGELHCNYTRIILVLNILKAYKKFRQSKSAVYATITRGFRRLMNRKLALMGEA